MNDEEESEPSYPQHNPMSDRVPGVSAAPPGVAVGVGAEASGSRSRLHALLAMRSVRSPYIYGAEIAGHEPLFRKDHLASNTFTHQDMVCSVCRSSARTSQVWPLVQW